MAVRPSDPPGHFHPGELLVHDKLGVQAIERAMRNFIRPAMPEQHRAFFCSLPFVIVAARDANGCPWATALANSDRNRVLTDSPDDHTLRFTSDTLAGNPLEHAFVAGADVGMLGIELHSRRRNRANGRVAAEARAHGSAKQVQNLTLLVLLKQACVVHGSRYEKHFTQVISANAHWGASACL